MTKNNIILFGIVFLFILVIRPLGKKNAGNLNSETKETTTQETEENLDVVDITEISLTPYDHSNYVQNSIQNAHNTVDDSLKTNGQSHTA